MKITLFGEIAKAVGMKEITLDFSDSVKLGEVLDALSRRYPTFAEYCTRYGRCEGFFIISGRKSIEGESSLLEGDAELLITTPVTGG